MYSIELQMCLNNHSDAAKLSELSIDTVPATLWWRHNELHDASNHQRLDCLLNRLFRCRSKRTSNSASLASVRGIHRWSLNSTHKGPVTWKMFPFDDRKYMPQGNEYSLFLLPTTDQEVNNIIKQLKDGASGKDGITSLSLKLVSDFIVKPITRTVNL